MVVCKCRKATKLYCFVHKVPVCGECICFPDHQICVVRTYSEWVIDGDYNWPPTCCLCQADLEAGNDSQTTRLGCLHIMHTSCLVSHIQSFPPHTAPAGYVCPTCSTSIWPPKSIKDSRSHLHLKLKEVISQTGLEKNLLGSNLVSLPTVEPQIPPPAFASDPLTRVTAAGGQETGITDSFQSIKDPSLPSSSTAKEGNYLTGGHPSVNFSSEIVEIESPSSTGNQFISDHGSNFTKSPGTGTRKGTHHFERENSEISYYADDEDGNRKKYSRRGSFHHKFLRFLQPFWSGALPTLPVTAPSRKDGTAADDIPEGRLRRQRPSRTDPRKILLIIAIMACLATMVVMYYRLAQRSLGENESEGMLP